MPDHVFFHFFFAKPEGHRKGKWMQRLPKKLRDSIFDSKSLENFPEGWGIHINESPNYMVISGLLFLGLVASGIIVVCWALLTKDVQGAFDIGSYLATVEAA